MLVQRFYYDPCILPNSVIADTDEGLFLFREGGMVHLTEMPPSSLELGLMKKRLFFHKKRYEHPQEEHLSNLQSAYTSRLDTIFFFENGALLQLMHRNFCIQGLHYHSGSIVEPTPIFYSATEAVRSGILEKEISANPFYSEIDCDAPLSAEPVESAYIVYPGYLLPNESHFFSKCCLRDNTSSIDFIMNTLNIERNPVQFDQFWQIPSLFCSFTRASFDHNAWNSQARKDYLSENLSYPFSIQGKCIAEITCIDTFCEPGNFPYHDSYTLTLSYVKAFDSEAKMMLRHLLHQYVNIIPVAPHLCGKYQ